jgi:outer membrane receptor for ferrienterochelin and colicin
MGITADSGAANASNTTLTSEQTGNGLGRALATYAHTGGTATYTMTKSWSVTGTVANLHRIGMFTASNTTAAGVMCFEAVLNADASVVSGDTLQVVQTVTLS